ncbi:MAG: flavodoxin family protein [Bacteroidota bacterium]
MKTIVVYESEFGNTEEIARAIGKAFASEAGNQVQHIDKVTPDQLKDVDLLIVGSPTQKFQAMPAVKSFIAKMPSGSLKSTNVAAFDTRISTGEIKSGFLRSMVRLFGYAAEPLAKKLKRKGGELIAEPAGFIVTGMKGPLKEGEVERAESWGKHLKKLTIEKKEQAAV